MNCQYIQPGIFNGKNIPGLKKSSYCMISSPGLDLSTQNIVKSDRSNFRGLSRSLSKRVYDNSADIKAEADKYKKSNYVVGSLPPQWIDKIPKEIRAEIIKEIYNCFKEASLSLRESHKFFSSDHIGFRKPLTTRIYKKNSIDILKEVLYKAKIINDKKDFSLQLVDDGSYGVCYKLTIGSDSFALKVFKKISDLSEEFHGNYIEINRAHYLNKNAKNYQFAKFYFGDLKTGYLIEDFISNKKAPPGRNLNLFSIGINYYDDHQYNFINGYLIDYGGFYISDDHLAKNKIARWVFKKIGSNEKIDDRLQRWSELFELASQNKIKNANDIILGLTCLLNYIGFYDPVKTRECYHKVLDSGIMNDQIRYILAGQLYNEKVFDCNSRLEACIKLYNNASDSFKKHLLSMIKESDIRSQFLFPG